jgi:hypothetical protein
MPWTIAVDKVTGKVGFLTADPMYPNTLFLSNASVTSFSQVNTVVSTPCVLVMHNDTFWVVGGATVGGINSYSFSTNGGTTWTLGSAPNGGNTTGNLTFNNPSGSNTTAYSNGLWYGIVANYQTPGSVNVLVVSSDLVSWSVLDTLPNPATDFFHSLTATSSGIVASATVSGADVFKFYS